MKSHSSKAGQSPKEKSRHEFAAHEFDGLCEALGAFGTLKAVGMLMGTRSSYQVQKERDIQCVVAAGIEAQVETFPDQIGL